MNQPQKPLIVVLGAAGFVGRHVCRSLADQDCEVIGVGHGSWTQEEWRAWGLTDFHACDIDLLALQAVQLPTRPVAIIHCAGSSAVSYSYAHPHGDFVRAVDTTAAALEWLRQIAPDTARFVMVSSAAIYGDQGDVDLVEASSHNPISPYGFHKSMAENLCDSYSRFFGLKISVVRLFSVYGEGLRKQLLWDALTKFSRGEHRFFGTGHELRDWIHVEDAARLLTAAANAAQGHFEIYNGGNEHGTTREVLTHLGAAWGTSLAPEFSGETHTGNPRRLTSDCGHAHRQLNWTPQVTLRDGLARYAAWFRSIST